MSQQPSKPADDPSGRGAAQPRVSVVILTLNEEINIEACIASCAWCDDVHVLDSGSADRTRELAERGGARVHVNKFESFGRQRNWAIDHIPMKHKWVFHLDADERFTPEVVRELAARIGPDGESIDRVACYRNPSKMMFMGRWIRHAAEYPVYQVRLFDRTACRFQDHGHGQRELTEGAIGTFDEPYLHFNFSKGLHDWFARHNAYSDREAAHALADEPVGLIEGLRALMTGDGTERRRSLKRLSRRVPCRGTVYAIYQTVFRLGFLDGAPGWNYIRMRAIYESMIATKLALLRQEQQAQRRPPGAGATP
ncbi:MAG TPA: glycosyltransferase [Phycisphaerales bacterium]|nr:glycosyltransferase [Phycisphaerales bacterium]